MNREIISESKGYKTEDGAGVKLVRVLSNRHTETYDPFLMLDSFDSSNPSDYTKGFPIHPHRGIETISYLVNGMMMHKDSMGNTDTISDGEVQYMTAGSGILHEERIPASKRMLGVQIWLNLSKKDKMTTPKYYAIKKEEIKKIDIGVGTLNLLMGNYKEYSGYQSHHQPLDYYDIELNPSSTFEFNVNNDKSIFLFTLIGEIEVEGRRVREKTAVKLSEGDKIVVKSLDNPTHLLVLSSDKLNESVAWGGPIVMNTREELIEAFDELQDGTFIKSEISY